MPIDLKAIYEAEIAALKAIALSNMPEVSGAISKYLILNSERLNELALTEDVDYIQERLKEEGDIIKSQLSSFEVFGQMIAKDAQDKTLQTIITTILAVLSQILIMK